MTATQSTEAIKNLIGRLERYAFRCGELWEMHQGNGWPADASEEHRQLRDEKIPDIRNQLLSLVSNPVAVHQEPVAWGDQLNGPAVRHSVITASRKQMMLSSLFINDRENAKTHNVPLYAVPCNNVPVGWQLVPTEFDPAMQEGLNNFADSCMRNGNNIEQLTWPNYWNALLAAAPKYFHAEEKHVSPDISVTPSTTSMITPSADFLTQLQLAAIIGERDGFTPAELLETTMTLVEQYGNYIGQLECSTNLKETNQDIQDAHRALCTFLSHHLR